MSFSAIEMSEDVETCYQSKMVNGAEDVINRSLQASMRSSKGVNCQEDVINRSLQPTYP